MTWCELCELDRSMCQHGLADRQERRARGAAILVSPAKTAHFEGCSHKGDDPDYSRWGTLDVANAWQRLGNGERFTITDNNGRALEVVRRCDDCTGHGPW
jgi:hypothetical protein